MRLILNIAEQDRLAERGQWVSPLRGREFVGDVPLITSVDDGGAHGRPLHFLRRIELVSARHAAGVVVREVVVAGGTGPHLAVHDDALAVADRADGQPALGPPDPRGERRDQRVVLATGQHPAERIDPEDELGNVPSVPLSFFGWGDIPDQYGRRWDADDGEGPLPEDPGLPEVPGLLTRRPTTRTESSSEVSPDGVDRQSQPLVRERLDHVVLLDADEAERRIQQELHFAREMLLIVVQ